MKQLETLDEITCRRKRDYTKKKAKQILKLLRTNEKGVHGHVYKCPVGDHWHITNWPKNLYRKINGAKNVNNNTNGWLVERFK